MYNLSRAREKIELSYTEIFHKIGENAIYFKYLGYYPNTTDKFKSPFCRDTTPSFSFRMYKKLTFKCFSTGKSGDAITLVSELYSESYANAAQRIINDFYVQGHSFNEYKVQNAGIHVRHDTQIQVHLKDFSERDLEYWKQGCITKETLDIYDVKVVQKVEMHKGLGWFVPKTWTYIEDNPIFRYKINNRYKLYRPLEQNPLFKWISNTNSKDIQGFKQLPEKGDILIITKSMKDVLCWHSFGFPAIAQCSESQPITDEFLKYFYTRFKDIYVNFDFDQSGIKEANKYSLPKIFTNSKDSKDPFDLIKEVGFEPARKILTNQIIF